ncbi:MAG: hypothetical protein OZX49_01298 [Immundisolibacter sp.]|nr:hypothetical protein [Immundisolibacter sp.]
MLVGEVRCATGSARLSCTLSGGSQWSSGPTKVSKKAQVRRASARRKRVCSVVRAGSRRTRGRLIHQAMAGDASHSSRIGVAAIDAAGRVASSRPALASAMAGATHMARTLAARSLPPDRASWRSTSLDGFHSSSRRRVTSIRHSVRAMASRLNAASYGRQASSNATCARRRAADRPTAARCCRHRTSSGLRHRSSSVAHSVGSARMAITARLQKPGDPSAQPGNSSSVRAAGTRLRRRLSSSFHCDSADSGLRSRGAPGGPGTRRRNQPASCQSPRIQRRRRLTSRL